MSNPFDQFGSDFNSALPQVPAYPPQNFGTQPATFSSNDQQQQPVYPSSGGPPMNVYHQDVHHQVYNGAPGGFAGQQPTFPGVSVYEQQSPGPSTVPPYSNDVYPNFGAPQPPVAEVRAYPDSQSLDIGNPFGAPAMEAPNASFGPPTGSMMTQGNQNYQLGVNNPVAAEIFPSNVNAGYSYPPDTNNMIPTNPPTDSNNFVDPWGGAVSQPQQQPYPGNVQSPTIAVPPQYPDSNYGGMQAPVYDSFSSQQDLSYGAPMQPVPLSGPNIQQDFNAGALVPSVQQTNPYAQMQVPQHDPNAGALVPTVQSNPYAQQPPFGQTPNVFGQDQYGNVAPPQQNPYGEQHQYGQQPPYQQQSYGQQPPPQYLQAPPQPVDPFSVFESQAKAPEYALVNAPPPVATGPNPTATDDDFWGSFGANNPEPSQTTTVAPEKSNDVNENKPKVEEEKKGDEGLPPGGEYYDARIFTPTLGVMFFKPQELTDSLFLNTDRDLVDALGERPVVAFIVEGSSARAAGVELGHVLLKVNGVDVRSPKEASRLIKEGPRPLPLLFYVPNTDVVTAEGEHMVKYDTRETTAPNSAKDWKPKYVVVGGIIAQPWMINMYRSKVSYSNLAK